MSKDLQKIIDELRTENKDYRDFRVLLKKIEKSKADITKDDILDLVSNDYRLQLHTTPNSIAQIIADISKENKFDNVVDICCGTGNILYYLQNNIDDLTGVEISENVAALTSFFVPNLKIITADSFKYSFSRKYDLVVGNLPWGLMIDYNGKSLRSEEAFIRKAFDISSYEGDIIFVVPYGLLIGASFKFFREQYSPHLKLILGLPTGILRSVNIKTAILHFSKNETTSIDVGMIQNIDSFKKSYRDFIIKRLAKSEIGDRWDPEFLTNQSKPLYQELQSIQTKKLSEIAEIINGRYIKKEQLKLEGDFLYLKPIHIQDNELISEKSLKYLLKSQLEQKDLQCITQPGDIIISTIFNDLKLYVYKKGDQPAIISNNLVIIRSANDDYIMSYLQTEDGKRIFSEQANDLRKGITIPHITITDLKEIKIPILPVSELNSLGNRAIEKANPDQLQILKETLNEYKDQISTLKSENNELRLIREFFENRFERIETQLSLVNTKLDVLLEHIRALTNDFNTIKKLPRDDEEKILKLCLSIDNRLDTIYKEEILTIENYIEEIKRWLDLWELLDVASQKFLPIAEFIYDKLSQIPEADYSPFVVQYCRALENEILKKFFEAYHIEISQNYNLNEFLSDDLKNNKTNVFAKMVLNDNRRYELGKMTRIMSLLKEGGNTLQESKLLQDFKKFVNKYFDERILAREFINDLEKIRDEFRNKAAHPYLISLEVAQKCQQLLRKNLNLFLESKKQKWI